LANLLLEGHEDINCFQNILRNHRENVIGEVRNNCQAHNSPRDTEIYLFTVLAKLNGLHDQLFDTPGDLIHKLNYNNPIEVSFVEAIEATFNYLIFTTNRIPRKSQKRQSTSVKRKEFSQLTKYHSLKIIDEITDEDLAEVLNTLKSYKFKSIDLETTEPKFKAYFSGNKVEFKVKWLRINALHYFITSLAYNDLLTSPENRIWELSSQCFADRNGKDLTAKQLDKTYPPKSDRVKKIINYIINDLRAKKHGSIKTR